MNPHDPITGCIHGSSLDPKCKGLTVKLWLVGRALSGYLPQSKPENAVSWAFKCANLVLEQYAQETKDAPVESQAPALPEDSVKPSDM